MTDVFATQLRPFDTGALAAAVHALFNGAVLAWGLDPHGSLHDRVDTDLAVLLDPYRAAETADH